jgi:uncharacterized membrane protein YqjE
MPAQRAVDEVVGLARQVLEMGRTRLEIATVELEREKAALGRQLALLLATAFGAALAAFAGVLWIALTFPPRARFILLGALFALFALVAVLAWFGLRRELARRDRLFGTLIDTLRRDRDALDDVHATDTARRPHEAP